MSQATNPFEEEYKNPFFEGDGTELMADSNASEPAGESSEQGNIFRSPMLDENVPNKTDKSKEVEMAGTSYLDEYTPDPVRKALWQPDATDSTDERAELQIKRTCRDILFIVIFALFVCGMIIISGFGFAEGDPLVLVYGPDYDGNVCNQNTESKKLSGFENRYWLNPNEVIAAKDDFLSLRDAMSICIKRCPQTMLEDRLSWVCKYPSDKRGTNVKASPEMTLEEWDELDYDYFHLLDREEQQQSFMLQGPCYPVVSYSRSMFHTCYPREFSLEVTSEETEDFKTCAAQCAAEQLTPQEYIDCVGIGCQASTVLATSPRVHTILPHAYLEFKAEAAKLGVAHAPIPPLNLHDQGGGLRLAVDDLLSDRTAVLQRYFNDFKQTWLILLICGGLLPFLLGFLWVMVMRLLTWMVVLWTVVSVNLLFIGITLILYAKAGVIGQDAINSVPGGESVSERLLGFDAAPPPPLGNATLVFTDFHSNVDEEAKHTMLVLAIIMTAVTLLCFVFTAMIAKQLKICVAVLQVAADVMGRVPALSIFPLLPVLCLGCFSAWWLASTLFLYSSGTVEPRSCSETGGSMWSVPLGGGGSSPPSSSSQVEDQEEGEGGGVTAIGDECGYEFTLDTNLQRMLIYMLLGFFWVAEFLRAATMVTIAGVTHQVYLHQGKEIKLPSSLLWRSLQITLRYHLGSVALGALVMAAVRLVRSLVKFILNRSQAIMQRNPYMKFMLCCIKCSLWTLEKSVGYISRSAYVLVAIRGEGFCISALQAAQLTINWVLQIALINVIGDFMLLLGRVSIAATCALLTFALLDSPLYRHDISSPLMPVVFVSLLSFSIASLFMATVEIIVDTVTLAFCDECQRTNGNPVNAPRKLKDAIRYTKEYEEEMESLREKIPENTI